MFYTFMRHILCFIHLYFVYYVLYIYTLYYVLYIYFVIYYVLYIYTSYIMFYTFIRHILCFISDHESLFMRDPANVNSQLYTRSDKHQRIARHL